MGKIDSKVKSSNSSQTPLTITVRVILYGGNEGTITITVNWT